MLVLSESQFNSAIETLSKHDQWVIDCETNGLDPYSYNQLCGIGIAVPDNAFYFPFRHQTLGGNLDSAFLPILMDEMNKIKRIVAYNLKFEPIVLLLLLQIGNGLLVLQDLCLTGTDQQPPNIIV